MRTSLSEIKEIEKHLLLTDTPENQLVFQGRLLLEPTLKENTAIQKTIYDLVQAYGQRELKKEIQKVQTELFTDPSCQWFQNVVSKIFKP